MQESRQKVKNAIPKKSGVTDIQSMDEKLSFSCKKVYPSIGTGQKFSHKYVWLQKVRLVSLLSCGRHDNRQS